MTRRSIDTLPGKARKRTKAEWDTIFNGVAWPATRSTIDGRLLDAGLIAPEPIPSAVKPDTPTLYVSPGVLTNKIEFTVGSDGGSPIIAVLIYRGSSVNFVPSGANLIATHMDGGAFIDDDLDPAVTYHYRIQIENLAGLVSSASTSKSGKPLPVPVPFAAFTDTYDGAALPAAYIRPFTGSAGSTATSTVVGGVWQLRAGATPNGPNRWVRPLTGMKDDGVTKYKVEVDFASITSTSGANLRINTDASGVTTAGQLIPFNDGTNDNVTSMGLSGTAARTAVLTFTVPPGALNPHLQFDLANVAERGVNITESRIDTFTAAPVVDNSDEIPVTLEGPYEPAMPMTFAGTVIGASQVSGDEDVLITGAQMSVGAATRTIKTEEGRRVRVHASNMGGYELSLRARENIAVIGVLNDSAGKPESDGGALGGVAGFKPRALLRKCRFVNFKGTDLSYRTAAGQVNVADIDTIERIATNRFRIKLKALPLEPIPAGTHSLTRRVIAGGAMVLRNVPSAPLDGYRWNYDIDWVSEDQLTWEGVVADLGEERFWDDVGRTIPAIGEVGTGGRVWITQAHVWDPKLNGGAGGWKRPKGQHSDSLFQIEDEQPLEFLTIVDCVTSGNYQVPGIIGTQGTPFKIKRLYAFKIYNDPQDPSTNNLFVKADKPGTFEDCYFQQHGGRPLAYYGISPRLPEVIEGTTANGRPRITWAPGARFQGEVIDGPPPSDYAPAAQLGTAFNDTFGVPAPTAANLTDITLTLVPVTAALQPGAKLGVLSAVHTLQGDVIEFEMTAGDTARVATRSAKNPNKAALITRRLDVGASGLAAGATYPITVTARSRRDPTISVQKTFNIVVP